MAEPTTRQALVEKAAQSLHDVRHASFRCTGEPTDQDLDQARALADLGLLADPAQTTELEKLRARIDAALEWWRQERDADHCWPLSFEDSAKVNSLRYRLYAALTGHPLAEQPLPGEDLRNAEERDDASEPSTSEVYDA